MGTLVSRALTSAGSMATAAGQSLAAGRKRSLQELDDNDDDDVGDDAGDGGGFHRLMHTPKRRKMVSTMNYIYETMFKKGEGSDVTLHAMEKRWCLHKLYLSQSPYFSSMFSSDWKEAHQRDININIVDPNITVEGLDTALGSLYHDEVQLQPSGIISVVAAASLFQMEGLLAHCCAVMKSCVNLHTATAFSEAALSYNLSCVQEKCQLWLETNLLTHLTEHPVALRQISPQMMSKLVSSPHLLAYQTEFSVYVVLKLWLYLRIKTDWCSDGHEENVVAAHKYFQLRTDSVAVLDTDEARDLAEPFRQLRLPHLITHPLDADVLVKDNIIPQSWMHGLYRHQWMTLLRLDQGTIVPGWASDVTQQQFDACALRCGRLLKDKHRCTWRWTGFNFGLDLVMLHQKRQVFVKRMQKQQDSLPLMISQAGERDIVYRISVVSLDGQRMPKQTQATGLRHIRLTQNQEVRVLNLDHGFIYPMYLSCSVMVAPQPFMISADM